MRILWLLPIVAACATEDEVSSTESALAGPHMLRVATFNLHGGIPIDPAIPDHNLPYENLAMDIAQIRSANADVVLLQEVHNHSQWGGCDDQPMRLLAGLGDLYPFWHYAPDTAQATVTCGLPQSWTAGQMILSKLPLANPQNALLQDTTGGLGDVYAQHATVVKDGASFHLYNTHFSTDPDDIVYEFQQLRSLIDATAGDSVIVAGGDFNWDIFGDTVPQAPMTSRPLFHHGASIDHLWSDWPSQGTEVTFPVGPSDHALRYWDLSWIGDDWITAGQKRAWALGASTTASSGFLYGRDSAIPARTKRSTLAAPWTPDARFGNPPTANPGFAVARTADGGPCEFVGWRDGTFKWMIETGAGCAVSTVASAPVAITSAPAVAAFRRRMPWFGGSILMQDYLVVTTLDSGGTLKWSHYEGTAAPGPTAFATWNIHSDGSARPGSSPAAVAAATGLQLLSTGCVQIFIRDLNDRLQTKSLCFDGSYGWSGWRFLDRPSPTINLASSPSVAADPSGAMHACIIGTDSQVWCKTFLGYPTYAWDPAFRSCGQPPGGAIGDPTVAIDGSDVIVYVRGPSNRVWMRRCNR